MRECYLSIYRHIPQRCGLSILCQLMRNGTVFHWKKRVSVITFPTESAYSSSLSINSAKVDDLKKIVFKFVPHEFRGFYDNENTTESSSQASE